MNTVTVRRRPGHRTRHLPTVSVLAICAVLLAGCGETRPTTAQLPTARCGAAIDEALVRGDRAVRATDSRVAVGIVVVDRRGDGCVSTLNASETFPTASVVKLLIAIDLLDREQDGSEADRTVERMLAASDDAIASTLWSSGGADAIITRTRDRIGLSSLSAPTTPGQWGSTRIDALDVARIWQWVLDEAPDRVRDPILAGTGGAQEIAADGVDQYFGIPDALPDSRWWIKQGWGSSRGRRIVNTTGVLGQDRDHILVMLTSHPIAVGFTVAARGATSGVAAMARAVD